MSFAASSLFGSISGHPGKTAFLLLLIVLGLMKMPGLIRGFGKALHEFSKARRLYTDPDEPQI